MGPFVRGQRGKLTILALGAVGLAAALTAAAFVAPFAAHLVKDVGRAYAVTADALELLARARRAQEEITVAEAEQAPGALPSSANRPEPDLRYRALGEDA